MSRRLPLLLCLVAASCGGRSGLGLPPGVVGDGAVPGPGADAARRQDLGRLLDQRVRPDHRSPRDLLAADSCLPIPAYQVEGSYQGAFKGQWICPGQTGSTSVSGNLSFKLNAAGGPHSFKVNGTMTGSVDPGLFFGTAVKGTMGCTSLSAQLPDITVGGGMMYKLIGNMYGTFQTGPAGQQGFSNGQWKATEPDGLCAASGTWYANKK